MYPYDRYGYGRYLSDACRRSLVEDIVANWTNAKLVFIYNNNV